MAGLDMQAITSLLAARREFEPILEGWPHPGMPSEAETLAIVAERQMIYAEQPDLREQEAWRLAGQAVAGRRRPPEGDEAGAAPPDKSTAATET